MGLTVASLVGIPYLVGPWSLPALLSNALTFWGLVLGGFTALVTTGLTFAVLNRRDRRKSRWGRVIAGVGLAVFTLGAFSIAPMWWFPPFSLEGLWIYPLEILTAVGAVVLLLPRRSRGVWDEPPGAQPEDG